MEDLVIYLGISWNQWILPLLLFVCGGVFGCLAMVLLVRRTSRPDWPHLQDLVALSPDGAVIWPGQFSVLTRLQALDPIADVDKLTTGMVCTSRLSVQLGLLDGLDASFTHILECVENPDDLLRKVVQLRQTGQGFRLQARVVLRGGAPVQDSADADASYRHSFLMDGLRIIQKDGRSYVDVVWFRDITQFETALHAAESQVQQLQTAQHHLQILLDGLPGPAWLRDADLSILACNRPFAAAVEAADQAHAVAENLELAQSDDQKREIRAIAASARAGGAARTGRFPLVLRGQRLLMDITETPQTMPTTAGQVPRQVTIGFAYDQSKTAEQAQKRQREIEAHQQVIARLSIATVVFAADTRVVFYNAAYARLWGFAPEWLDDTPSYSDVIEMLREKRLIPEVADFPAFKASELDRFQSLLHPVEDVIHTPHDVTLRRIIAPLPNGGLVQTFEDVTDNMALKRTMTALRETYEGVLDDLDVPVAMFESGGRLQFYNAALAALTGPDDLADNPLFVQWVERWATHVPDPETAAALRQWAGAWVLGQSQAALPLPYLQLVLRTRTLIDGGVVLTLVPLA